MLDIRYEIIKKIGIVSAYSKVSCEFNIVKWQNGSTKYDLRKWNDKGPQKGFSITKTELFKLYEILNGINTRNVSTINPKYIYISDLAKANIYEVFGVYKETNDMSGQVTFTSWGTGMPKIDFRSWNADYTICGKGISLTKNETDIFVSLIKKELGIKNESEEYDTSEIDDLLI